MFWLRSKALLEEAIIREALCSGSCVGGASARLCLGSSPPIGCDFRGIVASTAAIG